MISPAHPPRERFRGPNPQAAPARPDPEAPRAPVDPLRPLLRSLQRLQEYAAYYLSVKADTILLRVRKAVVWAAIGLMAAVAGIAILVYSAVLLLAGIAEGIAALLGGRPWAGDLLTGAIVFVILGLGVWLGLSKLKRSSQRKTVEKYEHRRNAQREHFGQDIHQHVAAHERSAERSGRVGG